MSAMRSQAGRRVTGWPCYRRGGQADRGEPRLGVVELGGDHVLDVGLQRGVRRPGLKSERPAGPPCRARAVPCPLTSADRDHAASANPARGAGYHALFRALVSLTQYIRLIVRRRLPRGAWQRRVQIWGFCASLPGAEPAAGPSLVVARLLIAGIQGYMGTLTASNLPGPADMPTSVCGVSHKVPLRDSHGQVLWDVPGPTCVLGCNVPTGVPHIGRLAALISGYQPLVAC